MWEKIKLIYILIKNCVKNVEKNKTALNKIQGPNVPPSSTYKV